MNGATPHLRRTTLMTTQNPIAARLEGLTVAKLQEMAGLLVNDHREGADVVFGEVLTRLETIMAEADFVAFCDAL